MVRQACAIGACLEKTYRRSEGVEFYNAKWIKDEEIRKAWKKKILATRSDVSLDQLNDVAICSRHFKDGDKNNLPTIIPRVVNGEVVWPDTSSRNKPVNRALWTPTPARSETPISPGTSQCSSTPTATVTRSDEQSVTEQPLAIKLHAITSLMNASPPKEVKEINKRKADELDGLSPLARSLYDEMAYPLCAKENSLTKKLKVLKEKQKNEQAGVSVTSVSQSSSSIQNDIILNLKEALDKEQAKNKELKFQLETSKKLHIFGVDKFKCSPIDFSFYTGLPDYLTFLSLLEFLKPDQSSIPTIYYEPKPTEESYVNTRGREEILGLQDQLFLVLCRLRQGFRETHLAHMFNVTQPTINRVISKWVKHIAHILDQLPTWVSKEYIQSNMPQSFKDLGYQNTRCIVDCTEIFIEKPSSNLALQSVLFSAYKNHHTAKGLIGIAPHGPITFASDLYVGSASDYDITKDCGLLKLLESGDHLMADKGFEVQKLLDDIQVRVDHPPILRGVTQMSIEQETTTRRIARLRIHVERAIERVKNFRILQETFPYQQWHLLNDIWKCCTKLVLLQPPLIDQE